jgi:hypothetical protein
LAPAIVEKEYIQKFLEVLFPKKMKMRSRAASTEGSMQCKLTKMVCYLRITFCCVIIFISEFNARSRIFLNNISQGFCARGMIKLLHAN